MTAVDALLPTFFVLELLALLSFSGGADANSSSDSAGVGAFETPFDGGALEPLEDDALKKMQDTPDFFSRFRCSSLSKSKY